MNETNPLNYGILYVDDEVTSLKYFREIFEETAPVFTAASAEEGFAVLQEHGDEIGIVLSDQRMPGQNGIDFLSCVAEEYPRPMRILVTAHADLSVAVGALNDGLLYAYLTKPWDPEELGMRLSCALEHFNVATERERLLEEKSIAFNHLLMADRAASIGILAAGLNHHLRNSLTVIRTFHELLPYQLDEEFGRKPQDADYFEDSYSEAKDQMGKLTNMLTNLWDSANGSSLLSEEDLDVGKIFRDAAEVVFARDTEVSFSLDMDDNVPTVTGDLRKLSQMARLLIQEGKSNITGAGSVDVSISSFQDQSTGQEMIQVSCVDDGKSIGEGEELERLFDPFYVRPHQPEEYGTNLMACYLTVFHHGGRINAERLHDSGKNAITFVIPSSPAPSIDQSGSKKIIGDAVRKQITTKVALSS